MNRFRLSFIASVGMFPGNAKLPHTFISAEMECIYIYIYMLQEFSGASMASVSSVPIIAGHNIETRREIFQCKATYILQQNGKLLEQPIKTLKFM